MDKILNIRLKNENYAIIEFDVTLPLTVPKLLVYELALRKGDEISEDQIANLSFENEIYSCEQKALTYLARRLHSVFELKGKLYQKKFSKTVINIIIDKMLELKYLDDHKYSELLVNESMNLRRDGIQKIKARLIEKGISKEIINSVLEDMTDHQAELGNIKIIGDKKLSSLEKRFTDKKVINQKLIAFLMSKGFSFGIIRDYLQKRNNEIDDYEE
jgi:regulatory protein